MSMRRRTTVEREVQSLTEGRVSRTVGVEIWERITSDRIKNMCTFSANKVTNDHRPLSARAGLPRLHPTLSSAFSLELPKQPLCIS